MPQCHSRNVNPEVHMIFFLNFVDILMLGNVIITPMGLYILAILKGKTQFCKLFCCSNRSNTTFLIKIIPKKTRSEEALDRGFRSDSRDECYRFPNRNEDLESTHDNMRALCLNLSILLSLEQFISDVTSKF